MAQSVTFTEETHTSVKKVRILWISGTGADVGEADGTSTEYYDGEVLMFVTDPQAAAPTDDYDVEIRDGDGIDILAGAGADRDTANTEYVLKSSLGCISNDRLTLRVRNAGDTKSGVVYLYIR